MAMGNPQFQLHNHRDGISIAALDYQRISKVVDRGSKFHWWDGKDEQEHQENKNVEKEKEKHTLCIIKTWKREKRKGTQKRTEEQKVKQEEEGEDADEEKTQTAKEDTKKKNQEWEENKHFKHRK